MMNSYRNKKARQFLDKNYVDKDFKISFNMSIETLKIKDGVEQIFNFLEKYSLDGRNLEISYRQGYYFGKPEKELQN